MNDNHDDYPSPQATESCSKRLWVLNALSDDESGESLGSLSPGLQFHLSRCPECRTLAEQLSSVGAGLRALADSAMPASLLVAANSQALNALTAGARMTGRVVVPDEPWNEPTAAAWKTPNWRVLVPMAAAASIIVILGLWGWIARGGLDRSAAPHGSFVQIEPTPTSAPATGINLKKLVGKLRERRDVVENGGDESDDSHPPVVELADAPNVARGEPRKGTRLPPCGSIDPFDAAFGADPPCVPRARMSYPPPQRNLGWGRLLDTSRPTVSTDPPTKDR